MVSPFFQVHISKRFRSPSPVPSIQSTELRRKKRKTISNPPSKPSPPLLPDKICARILSTFVPKIREDEHYDVHEWYYYRLRNTSKQLRQLVDASYLVLRRVPTTTISIVPVDTAGTVRPLPDDKLGYNVLKEGHVLGLKNSRAELAGPWKPVSPRTEVTPHDQRVHPREYYRTYKPGIPLDSDDLAKPLSRVEEHELIQLEADYSIGEKWPRPFFPYCSSPLYVYWKEPKDSERVVWEPADLEELARRTLESQLGYPIILKINKLVLNFARPKHIPCLLYYLPCTSTGLDRNDLRLSLFRDADVQESGLLILAPREVWEN
ncbi:hypothetical protein M427DRAFT_503395 [Gonapodya prolifera JEL478]|uniref:Uncharacterized protein n=1 Tax=Gonapodya prolifera (strain JEL478) TaxID=1344416 RepID=A0A139A5P9_GONPJ|nr:hypothetical protein M427DRAFT_503395 [Gonapodya prolifera JEL478]|eukprot:KXS12120.1 hypothetical protein M427DRAFT_503395 [Gonapodya prolifera JEL478]